MYIEIPDIYFVLCDTALGSAIVFEFIALFTLGMVLMLFTCKCAIVLIRERKGRKNDEVHNVELSCIQQASNETVSMPHQFLLVNGLGTVVSFS